MVRTYGPDTPLDLYFSISFPITFFIAYLATSCVMVAVVAGCRYVMWTV